MTLRKPFLYAFSITLGLFVATGALAWTGPCGASPSACNVSAPINVSSTGQTKVGGLVVNSGGAASGLQVVSGTTVLGGNVAVGIASPANRLHVNNTSGTTAGLRVDTVAATGVNGGALVLNAPTGSNHLMFEVGGVQKAIEYVSGNDLRFYLGGDRMAITSGGNVGIGTTVPSAKLEVANGTFRALDSATQYPPTTGTGLEMLSLSGTGFVFQFNRSTGTYGPIHITGSSINLGTNTTVSGSVTATAFYYSSDARLKKNVGVIAGNKALKDVLALEPVTYNWVDEARGTGSQLGFIAQQVESIVPELVTTDASTGMKAVDYARVAPLLVGALQAQQKQIDELKKEIEKLKAVK